MINWRLIIEEFGTYIQYISGVENIVADTLSRFPSTSINKYDTFTRKSQFRANKLFAIGRLEKNEDPFLQNILILQREQQKELRNINTKLSTYITDQLSSYPRKALDNVEIICYDRKIYFPQSLRRYVLYWCHLYFNHLGGSILAKKSERYVVGKALSRKRSCLLRHARLVNI